MFQHFVVVPVGKLAVFAFSEVEAARTLLVRSTSLDFVGLHATRLVLGVAAPVLALPALVAQVFVPRRGESCTLG